MERQNWSLEAESLPPPWWGDGLGVGTQPCTDASCVPLGQSSTLNHLAENNVFGIVPLAKVRGLWRGSGVRWLAARGLGVGEASGGLEHPPRGIARTRSGWVAVPQPGLP